MPPTKNTVCSCSGFQKFVLDCLKEISREQASRTTSGSGWLSDFQHRIQVKEKELGLGPGPKSQHPM